MAVPDPEFFPEDCSSQKEAKKNQTELITRPLTESKLCLLCPWKPEQNCTFVLPDSNHQGSTEGQRQRHQHGCSVLIDDHTVAPGDH